MGSLLIALDTETTGLPPNPDVRPVQIGAVAFCMATGKEIAEFRLLLRPDVWAGGYEKAERIHELRRDYVEAHGIGMRAGWDRFGGWVRTLTASPPWAGHSHFFGAWNSEFDRWVLSRWRQAAYPSMPPNVSRWPEFSVGGYTAPNGCLQTAYREWATDMPDIPTPKYGSLRSALYQFNLPNQSKKHDAVEDARLAGLVWWAMESRFRAEMREKHAAVGI